ncbi:MAG: hypothetical protein RLZZ127_1541, partial [Planctomycetota bacterium]
MIPTARINDFCRRHGIAIAANPCVSPDFCLDWPGLARRLRAEAQPSATLTLSRYAHARLAVAGASLELVSDEMGDHAWVAKGHDGKAPLALLDDGVDLGGG